MLIAEMLLLVAVNDKGHVPVGGDAFVDVGLTGGVLLIAIPLRRASGPQARG